MQYFYNAEKGIIQYEPATHSFTLFTPLSSINATEKPLMFARDAIVEKKPKAYMKNGRKVRTCKNCGKDGHDIRKCPKLHGEPESDERDLDVEFSDSMKEEINEMLMDGKGSREVAEHYNVSVKDANYLIGRAKGIMLPR